MIQEHMKSSLIILLLSGLHVVHCFQPSSSLPLLGRRNDQISSLRVTAVQEDGTDVGSVAVNEPLYLSENHIATLRKESAKRIANKRMPIFFLEEDEAANESGDVALDVTTTVLQEIGSGLRTAELVQVRGISRKDKKHSHAVADQLAIALSLEMEKDVNVVQCKGHAAVFYCPSDDKDHDSGSGSKLKLHTSVGKKNEWKKKPKPVRDNRGQIIPGLYE